MKLIILLSLLTASGLAAKILPDCTGGYLTYAPPPFGGPGLTEVFPDESDHDAPVMFPANYKCNIGVTVPVGMWAKVLITTATNAPAGTTSPVVVIDSLGKSENVLSSKMEQFYFLSSGGNVTLNTAQTNTSFVVEMSWYKYPKTFTPNNISLKISDSVPQVLNPCNNTVPSLVAAQSRVATVVIPPTSPSNLYQLRGIVFFDGPNWNRTYLGNAKQVWESGRSLRTEGNFLTVQFLSQVDCSDAHLLFQETDNVEQILNYQGVACSVQATSDCQGVLQTTSGFSAMSTYIPGDYGYETLTNLTGNGTLDVYIGGVTQNDTNLIATYAVGQSDLRIPQAFGGNVRTYVLRGNNTKAVINFTLDSRNSVYRNIGFQGFITSTHYTESPTPQWADARIEAPRDTPTAFSFSISMADITQNSQLNITIFESPNRAVYEKKYTASNLPALNEVVQVVGKTMTVEFDSMGDPSNGLYITYDILKSSSGICVVFSVLFALLVSL